MKIERPFIMFQQRPPVDQKKDQWSAAFGQGGILSPKMSEIKALDLDTFLTKYIGPTGRWQKRQIWLTYLQAFSYACCYYVYLFAAYEQDHRCQVDGCENDVGHRFPFLRVFFGKF